MVHTNRLQSYGSRRLIRLWGFDGRRAVRPFQKLLEIGEGTSEVQRIVISRYIGC